MDQLTSQQLLQEYAARRSEAAFAELVRRHVDLVYSAACRMVRDAQLAEDVTQGVFLALAQNARQLAGRPILSGWLHRTTQNLAANVVRSEVRRRVREGKAVVMNELLASQKDANWESIERELDTALGKLSEADRDALILRYFERKSASEIATALGVSGEAAQKRISRALDRLRNHMADSGVAVGAGALTLLVSSNAVQAAPAGLGLTISTHIAAITGTSLATTAVTAAKTIAMTTFKKTATAGVFMVIIGTGFYEARRASTLQSQIAGMEQRQAPLVDQVKRLRQHSEMASNQVAALLGENRRLQAAVTEIPKLRGELARMRSSRQESAQAPDSFFDPNDPATQNFLTAKAQAEQISHYLEQMPDKKIPEIALLTDIDWLAATKQAKFDSESDIRKTLSNLRDLAKQRVPMGRSLYSFIQANDGNLPNNLSDLKPFFQSALGDKPLPADTLDAIFNRYTLLHTGKMSDLPPESWIIVEKAPVDKEYDSRAKFGNGRSTVISTGINQNGDPDDSSY